VNEKSFLDVCKMLHAGHGYHQTGDRERLEPIDTLNELFKKHLRGRQEPILCPPHPQLSHENSSVSMKLFPIAYLEKIGGRPDSRLPDPRYMHLPVVIVIYRGVECLIDGGSRIHCWSSSGDPSRHYACILTVNGS